MGAEFRLPPGLWAACRRREGRAGQVVPCKQLRAFASVFERARSRFVAFRRVFAFSRVWSRLVAPIFFSCSDTFGHVWACSFVIFRHFSSFLVILRHSSSQNGFFGYGGQRAVAAAAGQGGQQFAARGSPAQGAGWAKWHGIHLKSVCSCGRAAAALVRLAHKCTTKAGRLQLLGIPGASRNGGAFLSCFEGQDSQQLSELWFRQSVCWRQLTAAAQAASSLTRIRRVAVRFWRQATCICHLLEQFFNRRGSRNRLRARGPRSQGHVPPKFGMHPPEDVSCQPTLL